MALLSDSLHFNFPGYGTIVGPDVPQIDPILQGSSARPVAQAVNWQQRCQALELELYKVRLERDAFQQLYTQQLSNQTSIAVPALEERPTPVSHKNVRFWRKSAFDRWLDSPDTISSAIERGPIPWLEQENGNPVDAEECTAIKATVRRGFSELVSKGCAPRSWGLLCASGRELIDALVQKYHPVFKYDLDGWKLHHLATLMYPQWRSQHLDENLVWKRKTQIKLEGDATDSGQIGEKRKQSNHGSKRHGKRAKIEVDDGLSPKSSDSINIAADPTSDRQSPVPDALPRSSTSNVEDTAASPGPEDSVVPAFKPAMEQCPETMTKDDTLMADKSNPISNGTQTANSLTKTAFRDPLSEDALEAAGIDMPCLASPNVPMDNMEDDDSMPDTSIDIKTTAKKRKYKPGSAKNGRNLCAIRWVKQNDGGSASDFKRYYDALTAETRKMYYDEAAMLVSKGQWKTGTTAAVRDGTMY